MSSFWSAWITVLTIISIVLICWLLFSNRKTTRSEEGATTGHVYDGIEEYDNPMPKWWINLFVLSIIYAVGYLVVYPGLGNFPGLFKWTSIGQWEQQLADAQSATQESFSAYASTPVEQLADNAKAMRIAKRIFANNCAACHGSNGAGLPGYPNLRDNDWLYGGTAEQIKTTLVQGRIAAMPGWESVLGFQGLDDMTSYVMSLGKIPDANQHPVEKNVHAKPAIASHVDRQVDRHVDKQIAQQYTALCSACHGADAKGNTALGAPNLTDNIWLYGGSEVEIRHSIAKGRRGQMPAQAELLGSEKIHLLTAYVFQLSSH